MNMAMAHLLMYNKSSRPLQAISTRLPFMGETDSKIGEFILSHPEQVAELSSSELAEAVGVGEASLFRFLGRIGYSYNDLRLGLVRHVELTRVLGIHSPLSLAQDDTTVERTEASISGLAQAFAYLMPGELNRAAQAIYETTCVQVCGIGPISAPIAEIIAYKLNDLGCTAVIRTSIQPGAEGSSTAQFGRASDVLLAISHSGTNRQIHAAIEDHQSRGGISIAITNYDGSPIAEAATIGLVTSVREPVIRQLDLIPRLAQLMTVEILLETIARMKHNSRKVAT